MVDRRRHLAGSPVTASPNLRVETPLVWLRERDCRAEFAAPEDSSIRSSAESKAALVRLPKYEYVRPENYLRVKQYLHDSRVGLNQGTVRRFVLCQRIVASDL